MVNHIKKLYTEMFDTENDKAYFSPGRVNIIGGHTDYNGGFVLPFCIDTGIYAAIGKNEENQINIYSENFASQGIISIVLKNINYDKKDLYSDYVLGVIKELKNLELTMEYGLNICLSSNLPVGGGLSSSAALCVLLFKVFNDEFSFGLDRTTIAKLSKKVENEFIGVNCGIMDQFVVANGVVNHAIFLNTQDLSYEQVPIYLEDYALILVNSNTTRRLTESKYNTRQMETKTTLKELQAHFDLNYLCDVSLEDYPKYAEKIMDPTLRKRFLHLVTENDRVKKAKVALVKNDYLALGKLLTEAHASARDHYEVSSEVLDDLVEMALNSGSLGSKMIGGGFGGSTLNLVKTKDLNGFINRFSEAYQKKYFKQFIYHQIYAKDGVKRID